MRLLFLLLLSISQSLIAQKKDLTLEDIWLNGTFNEESLEAFHSMTNSDHYTVLNQNSFGTYLDKFDYVSLEKVETVVLSKDLEGISRFEEYAFDRAERKLILGVDLEKVFRNSKKGKFYVYNLENKDLEIIVDQNIMVPTFSPDGAKIAYVYENNIYLKDLNTHEIQQVTFDGKKNEIINGIPDWVYEEEFKIIKAFEWNENSDMLAYIRFDEKEVPQFSMDIYGSDLYPTQQVIKYPKAGEKNSEVSLQIYDLAQDATIVPNLKGLEQYYMPRIQWTHDPYGLVVTTLNRHQNNLNLVLVNAQTNATTLLLNEKDKAYVGIRDDLTFLQDNSFIWTSEKDGYNHIYHYDKSGGLIRKLTSGNWEVTSYYGFDESKGRIFFQSTEEGSVNRSIYSVSLSGKKKKKLSSFIGTNDAVFSKSFHFFVNTFSSSTTATNYTLVDSESGEIIKEIKNNKALQDRVSEYAISEVEFSTLQTKNGEFNMYMIKPSDFDPSKKYPLLMYQYSGPGSQTVVNRWKDSRRPDYWHQMMAQEGYIIACVDGRGTGFKGAEFKKSTYLQLGKYEVEDQIEAARELGKLDYIDDSRIGIWGWSYGGYMSSLAITKGADVFKMAIAVAPVTSWRFYDTVYTERYMRTPQENSSGYDDNSPLNFAHLLEGDYLLIHGTGDDNVHVQNSMRMIDALVDADKQFDYLGYPDRAHGISIGRNTRLHLFQKMTTFIRNSLGEPLNHKQKIIH